MCLAIPGKIIEFGEKSSIVDILGVSREVSTEFLKDVKMGDYVYRLGQIDVAANWYQQATIKDPNYSSAYRQLGYIALAKQDQTEAAALLGGDRRGHAARPRCVVRSDR